MCAHAAQHPAARRLRAPSTPEPTRVPLLVESRLAPRQPCAARRRVPFSIPRPSVWLLLITDLDNRDENHPMAVRVNCLPIYTRPGTVPPSRWTAREQLWNRLNPVQAPVSEI